MKNFVFISPNFPLTYWKFCRELKNNGMRVLGIGDCPYEELMQELKKLLSDRYGASVHIVTNVGPVIGAHSGPGTLALFFIGKEK